VSVMDGSSTLCTAVALASGSASCTSNALTVGSHTIAANYSGDSSYGAASASIPQTVNAPLPPAKSEITSPAPGSTLSGTTITFSWTAGSQVVERYLMVGTMAGGSDLYAGYQGNATSRTVSGIPQDGSTVFVRLMSYINGGWETADYSYATAGSGAPPPTPQKSTITSPADGSTLSSATVTFTWTAGSGVAERYLQVGTAMGGSDIYAGYQGSATSKAVSGIPQDGRIVYVRLMSYMGGAWQVADYTYSGGSGTPPPAPSPTPSAIISPTPGSTLAGSTATFTWDAGSGVTERYLMVGTTPGGSQVYAAYQGTASSRTVTGLPSNGSTVYVSLASWIEGNWQVNSYTYRAAGP